MHFQHSGKKYRKKIEKEKDKTDKERIKLHKEKPFHATKFIFALIT